MSDPQQTRQIDQGEHDIWRKVAEGPLMPVASEASAVRCEVCLHAQYVQMLGTATKSYVVFLRIAAARHPEPAPLCV